MVATLSWMSDHFNRTESLMNDQKNLILAIAASVVIMVGFQFFFEGPRRERELALQQQQAEQQAAPNSAPSVAAQPPSAAANNPGQAGNPVLPQIPPSATVPGLAAAAPAAEAAAGAAPRIDVQTPRLHGTISLRGGRIDQVTLSDYHLTTDPQSPPIVLFSPAGTENPYFAQFGWLPQNAGVAVPGPDTLWQSDARQLTPESPIVLTWDNGQGLRF